MVLVTVTVALLFAQAQFAPSDVPKNHWAYPAVNQLFQEGLLKGYPNGNQPKLSLDKTLKFDQSQAIGDRDRWIKQGLLVNFPVDCHGVRTDPTKYELAVAVWNTSYQIQNILKASGSNPALREVALSEIRAIAEAISMLNFELTKLGADTKVMIASLNDLQYSRHRQYLGNR